MKGKDGSGRAAVLLMLLAVAATACTGGGDETAAGVATTGEDATTTSETTTTIIETTTTQAITTTTAATTAAADTSVGEDCLVGEWEVDSEAFIQEMTTAMGAEAPDQDVTMEFVGGSYTITMGAGGRFLAARDEWSFEMSASDGTFRVTIDGTDSGVWAVEEETLVVSDVESASVLTAQAVVDGQVVDLPMGTVPLVDTNAVGERATFECSEDILRVESSEGFVTHLLRVGP